MVGTGSPFGDRSTVRQNSVAESRLQVGACQVSCTSFATDGGLERSKRRARVGD